MSLILLSTKLSLMWESIPAASIPQPSIPGHLKKLVGYPAKRSVFLMVKYKNHSCHFLINKTVSAQ